MPSITCYVDKRKRYGVELCEAFARGCGGEVVTDWVLRDGIAVVHGCAEQQRRIMRDAEDWYEIDHAYFGRMAYHRVTHRALWSDGKGRADHERLQRLGLHFGKPRVQQFGDVLLAAQSEQAYLNAGTTMLRWLSETTRAIGRHSRRSCLIRNKPIGRWRTLPPFVEQMSSAWIVVTHSSSAAFEALAAGLPVIVTERRFPAALLGTDVASIETPRRPPVDERRDLFARLAAQQWTVEEMASGQCWRELQDGIG